MSAFLRRHAVIFRFFRFALHFESCLDFYIFAL